MQSWGRVWALHATQLIAESESLGQYRMFVDQIAWALTLQQLAIPFAHLPDTLSYPVAPALLECTRYQHTPPDIACFHLGKAMNDQGQIRTIGIAALDAQVETANRRIAATLTSQAPQDENLKQLFQRWQTYRAAVTR
jgi:hypothetical protein